jgi:hypothetical protein
MSCEEFLEDPAAHPEHTAECAECRRLVEDLDRLDEAIGRVSAPAAGSIAAGRLPLAPWEGARYRSWTLLAMIAIIVAGAATAAFAAAGVSPLAGFGEALGGAVAGLRLIRLGRSVAAVLWHAPATVHVSIAVAFIAVNAILFWLVRKPTRGYDVSPR